MKHDIMWAKQQETTTPYMWHVARRPSPREEQTHKTKQEPAALAILFAKGSPGSRSLGANEKQTTKVMPVNTLQTLRSGGYAERNRMGDICEFAPGQHAAEYAKRRLRRAEKLAGGGAH